MMEGLERRRSAQWRRSSEPQPRFLLQGAPPTDQWHPRPILLPVPELRLLLPSAAILCAAKCTRATHSGVCVCATPLGLSRR